MCMNEKGSLLLGWSNIVDNYDELEKIICNQEELVRGGQLTEKQAQDKVENFKEQQNNCIRELINVEKQLQEKYGIKIEVRSLRELKEAIEK